MKETGILASQIAALLDLIQCQKGADDESINVAAEMAITMLDELMEKVDKLELKLEEKSNE